MLTALIRRVAEWASFAARFLHSRIARCQSTGSKVRVGDDRGWARLQARVDPHSGYYRNVVLVAHDAPGLWPTSTR